MTTKLPPGVVTVFESQTGDGTSHILVFAKLPPTTPTLIDSLETRVRAPRKFSAQVSGLLAGIVYLQKSDDGDATWTNHLTISSNGIYEFDAVTFLRGTTTGVPMGALTQCTREVRCNVNG